MFLIGIVGHFIFVFQTYKIFINKSSGHVSLPGFSIAFLSIISWLFYGFLKDDKVLIRVNLFGALASAVCLLAIIFFK